MVLPSAVPSWYLPKKCIYIPQLPPTSSRDSKIQQVGLTQGPFKLLPLDACPLRVESVSYSLQRNLQSQMSWGLSSQCQDLQAWKLNIGSWTPCSLQRNSAVVIILPFVDHIWIWGLDFATSTLSTHFIVIHSLSVQLCKIFSASFQFILIDECCSVNSYNFGVSLERR